MTAHPWLKVRNAEIKPSANGQSWLLYQGDRFIWVIGVLPADGKFTNKIMESINGNQIQKGSIFDSEKDALEGGLMELKAHLGW
jgi:hypothetical protein